MLQELRIKNIAVIDQVALELGPALNVLTGETGAGKTIVLNALGLILGARGSSDLIRGSPELILGQLVQHVRLKLTHRLDGRQPFLSEPPCGDCVPALHAWHIRGHAGA